MSEIAAIDLPLEAIRDYCATQPIERLSLFGSDFDGWLRPDADRGFLVEYLPVAQVTYIDMARQERELGEIMGGALDLRTVNELEDSVRRQLLEGTTLVFVQDARE